MHRSATKGTKIITDLIQLIYASQPFGYDTPTLNGILVDARRCNARDDITGALVCRRDIYLQLLEGPRAKVEATYARIVGDDRHANAQKLVSHDIPKRIFADWAMLHDPAKTVIWSQQDISNGILQNLPPEAILAAFEDLAQNTQTETGA